MKYTYDYKTIGARVNSRASHLSADDIDTGAKWYASAHNHALELSTRYNMMVEKVSAIIAVLSPATNWEQNLKDAEAVIRFNEAATVTTYTPNKVKALAILNDADIAATVKGNKVKSFFDNISRPCESDAVTIDRHMLRLMLAVDDEKAFKRVFGNKKVYDKLADIIRRKAYKMHLKPCELQAALWCKVREAI